jgi:hypothetical protein
LSVVLYGLFFILLSKHVNREVYHVVFVGTSRNDSAQSSTEILKVVLSQIFRCSHHTFLYVEMLNVRRYFTERVTGSVNLVHAKRVAVAYALNTYNKSKTKVTYHHTCF